MAAAVAGGLAPVRATRRTRDNGAPESAAIVAQKIVAVKHAVWKSDRQSNGSATSRRRKRNRSIGYPGLQFEIDPPVNTFESARTS